MRASDLPQVLAVEQLCYPQPWSQQQFRRELDNPGARIDLLEFDGELAGYLVSWQLLDELEIQNLATAPQWRRNGVARRLLEALLERAVVNGTRRLLLEVRAGNRAAIALYRQFGFRTDGTRRGYYSDGEDALLMSRVLP